MEIVIKISNYDKEWITNGYYIPEEINTRIAESIANGTPLPEQQPCKDCVSREAIKEKKVYSEERHEYVVPVAEIDWLPSVQPQSLEQIKWERDTAINQLQQLGYGLGEKVEPCEDCVSREAAINVIYDYTYKKDMRRAIEQLPSVKPQRSKGKWMGTVCTNCGNSIGCYYDCDFCPMCGAEMEGDNE